MKLKLLLVIGAVAPSFAIYATDVAAESRPNMVIAQAPPAATDQDKDKDKRHPPPGKDKKGPVNKPAVQQQPQKPVQQQQLQKPAQQQQPQKPAQQQPLQKPAQQHQLQRPAQQQQLQKPAQQQQQLQKPAQQQPVQKPVQQQPLQKPTQQQPLQKPVQQQPLQRPAQQQQLQKPAQQGIITPPTAPQQSGVVAGPQNNVVAPNHKRLDQIRGERREIKEGNRLVIQEPGRTIIREGGHTIIRHDEINRFRMGARDVHVTRRGSDTETIIIRPDGSRIISIVDTNGRLLRRVRRLPDGREIILIDNRYVGRPDGFGFLVNLPPPVIRIPHNRYIVEADRADRALLYETLIAPPIMHIDRRYTLDEIRYSHSLRERMRRIDLDTITFDFGSWEITPDQARMLEPIADALGRAIRHNPNVVFLIEGHTDAVGSFDDNISLADHRAEAVAEILTQEFGIPPENLATQGYGEQYLKIPTQGPERRNRRVTILNIRPLMFGQN
jgi:outer membrane protein OmpA-like peptidoglycan-associated protein